MPFNDLRDFLAALEANNEITRISGAHWDMEMGVISELAFERQGPALLFENIAEYPADYRIVSNLCTTSTRALMALGIDPQDSGGIMRRWKDRLTSYRPVPPVRVSDGPILENEFKGQEIDLLQVSGAALARIGWRPIHRHRRLRYSAGSRRRPHQCRDLPTAGAGPMHHDDTTVTQK